MVYNELEDFRITATIKIKMQPDNYTLNGVVASYSGWLPETEITIENSDLCSFIASIPHGTWCHGPVPIA